MDGRQNTFCDAKGGLPATQQQAGQEEGVGTRKKSSHYMQQGGKRAQSVSLKEKYQVAVREGGFNEP